ncbi:lipoprotein-releasing system permease protein [Jezberella montanilacus]|uniref:Lipoprotein-releasing system permease protein n=1 Tax=Jezberella montanilacus TaxID=323426 RepID=A0A2T0XJE0_9BURK|nr:lipoprotein-releasing system permease protein [Jezberella montanilacus]
MIKLPYELWIGARYAGLVSLRGQRGGRDKFVSFVAATSMVGIALGVAALIVVLSVMNGFQKEVRDRMLSVLPHVELYLPGMDPEQVLQQTPDLMLRAKQSPEVLGEAPFVAAQAMVMRGQSLRGVQVRGIEPTAEAAVSDVGRQMVVGKLTDLKAGGFGVVIGAELADALSLKQGDTLMMLAPQGSISPAGFAPRMRQFAVVGIFRSGHYEYDSSLVFTHVEDTAKMFRDSGTAGVRLKVKDMYRAPDVALALASLMPRNVLVADWSRNNKTWFDAVQTEKRMMFLILALIVAVAAFNLLSSLVMAVKDKQSDIAILRSFGSTPGEIAKIFLVQGALIGVIGTLLGVGLGCLIAFNIDVIIPALERMAGVQFLPREVYFISRLPSDPRITDIATIGITSLVMSLLATLYPSWRASRLQPAQVLRHD